MSRFAAPEVKNDYVPAFVVEKLDGTFKKSVTVYEKTNPDEPDSKDRKLVQKEIDVPCGYMVHFPRGHSIHVADVKELDRMGYSAALVPLIKMDEDQDGSNPAKLIPNVLKETKK